MMRGGEGMRVGDSLFRFHSLYESLPITLHPAVTRVRRPAPIKEQQKSKV
jgi:hypothetical protein